MTTVDDKRTAILQATLRLIATSGFHGTAMSQVAKEAGVSTGIIYHYFDNKDELIRQLYIHCKQELSQAVMGKHDASLPLRAQLRTLWDALIREMLKRPHETMFKAQFYSSPYYTPEVEAVVAPYFATFIDCFERGKKEMLIRDMPMALYATFFVDIPNGLVRREAAGMLELTDELIEETVEALWQAVRM